MNDIHTCDYFCERPGCIKAQRDELRERLFAWIPVGYVYSEDGKSKHGAISDLSIPNGTPLFTSTPVRNPTVDRALLVQASGLLKRAKELFLNGTCHIEKALLVDEIDAIRLHLEKTP